MSLQGRIALLLALIVAGIVALLVYLGISAVDETEDTAQRQRLTWTAQAMAGHVDDVLTRTAGREAHLSQMIANAWSQGEDELLTLLKSYPSFLFESDLYLVRPTGDLVWSMRPDSTIGGGLSNEPLVRQSLESLQSAIGSCAASTTQDRTQVCFASPVTFGANEPAGILLAQVDLSRPDLNLFSLEQLNDTFRIELVAADGLILASNQSDSGETSSHAAAVATLSSRGDAGDPVQSQHADDGEGSHPFGYASLSMVPGWGVVVEPTEPATLAVAGGARQQLLLFGSAAFVATAILVWLGAGHLLRPLGTLTASAARLGKGDLSTPVAVSRRDKVGELAEVLESLRVALKAALADVQHVHTRPSASV